MLNSISWNDIFRNDHVKQMRRNEMTLHWKLNDMSGIVMHGKFTRRAGTEFAPARMGRKRVAAYSIHPGWKRVVARARHPHNNSISNCTSWNMMVQIFFYRLVQNIWCGHNILTWLAEMKNTISNFCKNL